MFGKGNNMFQGKVKHEAEAIKNLLAFVPEQLEKLRDEMNASIEAVEPVEYEEWDYYENKVVPRIWYPSVDTSIIDEMKDAFYLSIVEKIYSFAENGLKILSGVESRPHRSSKQKTLSDIDVYLQKIEKEHEITLPPIEDLWPNKDTFHLLRKQIAHHGQDHLTKTEIDHLATELGDALKLLLCVEERIRDKNPHFDPKT